MLHCVPQLGFPSAIAAAPLAHFLGAESDTSKVEWAGTHRSLALSETLRRALAAAERAGVTRVADLTGLDNLGVPVFSSIRPNAEEGSITVTNGKGLTQLAARVSALMEAVERYAGQRNERVGPVLSYADAKREGRRYLNPRAFILAADSSYADDVPVEWWPARDLLSGAEVFVPAAVVLFPYREPPRLYSPDTNGLASGNAAPEALLHALLELIERDATAFGELCRDGERLDLEGVDDADIDDLLARFSSAGVDIHVHVFSTELGLPVFHVLADDTSRADPMFINGGFGCHLDPKTGLLRALTEAAQSRATVISGAREDLAHDESRRELGYTAIKRQFESWFESRGPCVQLRDIPDRSTHSISADLQVVLGCVRDAGFRHALAVDLTMPGLEVAVVRALLPGAEHFVQNEVRCGPRLLRRLKGIRAVREGRRGTPSEAGGAP